MVTPADAHDLAQDCYTMAYFVLPRYAHDDPDRLVTELTQEAIRAGTFYVMACRMNGREPRMELLRSFPVHTDDLDEATRYCVIEYPTPPVVDLSELSLEEMFALGDKVVLAPYFSAVVRAAGGPSRYFILGQSPDGWTTLRVVAPTMNANLGPGCEPELGAFVALLRERLSSGV